ncbi:recombinase family protein [Romboutsia sp.]|uniref:recombinase family protein n=1 Tax=Romboutsia sp. TaxID=1965302 RepID=UPI002BE0DF04|nr:recombinase family protein [Romboutsia sp.]HSQ88906.1 recombinase family protein [Romboutsia sp.]
MRKKTVVLTRFSSILQDNISQKIAIEKYINENRIVVDEWIEEDAVSGFKTRLEYRVGLMKIKAMAMNQELDTLIIFNLDRIGRRMELVGFINLLDECGVTIVSVTEGIINNGNDTDSLISSIKMWMSEYESKKISERVKNGKLAIVRQGFHQGGTPNFGYKVVDKKLVIDEEESKIVSMIFELYIAEGISGVLEIFKEKGINKRGEQFNRQKILKLLHNPIYIGLKKYKDELIEIPELRIVDNSIFNKAQQIMRDRRTKGTTKHVNKSDALLEGLLWHRCNDEKIRKLHIDYVNVKGKKKPSYRCNYCKNTKAKINKNYISTKIEPKIEGKIKEIMKDLSIEILEQQYSLDIKESEEKIKNSIKDITKNIIKKNRAINKATDEMEKIFIGESSMDIEIINNLIQKLTKEVLELKEQLDKNKYNLEILEKSTPNALYILEKYKKFDYLYDNANNLEKKKILQELINRIVIGSDKIDLELNV